MDTTDNVELELMSKTNPMTALVLTVMAAVALAGIWYLPALGLPRMFAWAAGLAGLLAAIGAVANGAAHWAWHLLRRSPGSVAVAALIFVSATTFTIVFAKIIQRHLG